MKYSVLFLLLTAFGANAAQNVELKWPSSNPTKTCVFSATSPVGSTMTGDFVSGECPSVQPSGPVITDNLNELPATATVGSSATVSWSANADQCTYANSAFPAAVAGWPVSTTPVCNGNCMKSHVAGVTFPVAGTYQFNLTCSNNNSPTLAVATKTVQVSSPNPVGCLSPAGLRRHVYGTVANNNTSSRETDLTKYENVFGYNIVDSNLRLFPGTANLNQRIYIPRGYYVSLQFTVPATLPLDTYGQFRFEETQPQTSPARMSFTISSQCGDFSTTTAPACVMNNGPANSSLLWGYVPSNPRMCQLVPGQTYYLNIVHASLSNLGVSYCAGHCGNTIQNQKFSNVGW